MEIECLDFSKDDFSRKFHNGDHDLLQFYQNLSLNSDSIDKVLSRPVKEHTDKLADIIKADMSRYGLNAAQEANLNRLKAGHRVVIAGQQAGLFMSPSYIIHKIISILIVTREIKEKYDYEAVPVFWVAGEDHDFEEVNHTFVYEQRYRRSRKISYKPNLNVPMSIGYYEYDKEAMHDVLQKIIAECGDGEYVNELKDKVHEEIDAHTYWTELFHSLVHDAFKEDGLILFNSHLPAVRKLEAPFLQKLLKEHETVDEAFRSGQEDFTDRLDTAPMLTTESNVHLFSSSMTERHLIIEDNGRYQLADGEVSFDSLFDKIEDSPEEFSNNVVTRPLMQEMLFNTLVFLGGGAETKYWGELHQAFKTLDLDMPIVLERMKFLHLSPRVEKLIHKYDLTLTQGLTDDIAALKDKMMNEEISEEMLSEMERIRSTVNEQYDRLQQMNDKKYMEDLIRANLKIHLKQLDYLERRYHIEARRHNRKQLNDLDEITEILFPGRTLQERLYHPWQYMTHFREFPPLSYTTQLIVLKSL